MNKVRQNRDKTNREFPIIFSTESVRAILDGRKTMTRRLLSPAWAFFGSAPREFWRHCDLEGALGDTAGRVFGSGGGYIFVAGRHAQKCDRCREMGWAETVHRLYPRHNPGDLLWVRETWAPTSPDAAVEVLYRAEPIYDGMQAGDFAWKWKSSMFMPRWASRIALEVTASRIERLHNFTEIDAIAEGAPRQKEDHVPIFSHRAGFERLWDSLHRKPGTRWEDNPWVVPISFKRINELEMKPSNEWISL